MAERTPASKPSTPPDASETRPRVVIAEDHAMLREGIRNLLEEDGEMRVVAEASTGEEALELAFEHRPDLVLMDISMPGLDGLEAARTIKAKLPGTRIMICTVHDASSYIDKARQAGADGYILKDASTAELLVAIDYVLKGKPFFSVGLPISPHAGQYPGARTSDREAEMQLRMHGLTNREKEITELVVEGLSNADISEQLHISIKTVEKHKSNILRKLGMRSSRELVRYLLMP